MRFSIVSSVRLVVVLLLFLTTTFLFGQSRGAIEEPIQLKVTYHLVKSSSVVFTFLCRSYTKFTDGLLYVATTPYKSAHTDSTVLWQGSSDTSWFERSFQHTVALPVGQKMNVRCFFSGRDPHNNLYGGGDDIYFSHRPDTLIRSWSNSYDGLEWDELNYDIYKRGYAGMSENEIRQLDCKLWKKIQRVKHGVGRKHRK
jgi:hypothetical protein